MWHVISSCSTFLPSTIEIFQRVLSYRADMKSFSNPTKGDNSESKKARVVNLVCNMSFRPDLHFYQVSSNYSKGYSRYRADKKFYADANNMSPPTPFRVLTFRIDQNSLTFPWLKFTFPWQYRSRKFYEFSKKNTSGPNIPASSGWNAKFPDISLTFLQNYIFPWHISEFPDNSLTLKKMKFPWHFPDMYEPCLY